MDAGAALATATATATSSTDSDGILGGCAQLSECKCMYRSKVSSFSAEAALRGAVGWTAITVEGVAVDPNCNQDTDDKQIGKQDGKQDRRWYKPPVPVGGAAGPVAAMGPAGGGGGGGDV